MIRRADESDLHAIAHLATELWPHLTEDEMTAHFAATLQDAAIFLAEKEGRAIGLAQCQVRSDYVEGAESSPVGYLEGVFVREGCRRQGHARALVRTCESWARAMGCREFASDCALGNDASRRFHLGMGFREVGRIICFTKPL